MGREKGMSLLGGIRKNCNVSGFIGRKNDFLMDSGMV